MSAPLQPFIGGTIILVLQMRKPSFSRVHVHQSHDNEVTAKIQTQDLKPQIFSMIVFQEIL